MWAATPPHFYYALLPLFPLHHAAPRPCYVSNYCTLYRVYGSMRPSSRRSELVRAVLPGLCRYRLGSKSSRSSDSRWLHAAGPAARLVSSVVCDQFSTSFVSSLTSALAQLPASQPRSPPAPEPGFWLPPALTRRSWARRGLEPWQPTSRQRPAPSGECRDGTPTAFRLCG